MDFLDSRFVSDLTLTFSDAIDPQLATAPSARNFGGNDGEDLKKGQVRLRIGERPIVRNLKELYLSSHKDLPPDLEVFSAYNIWLIAFGVGIIRESGLRDVVRFGFTVTFADKPRVTVLDVLPQTEFVKRLGTELKVETALSLNGSAGISEKLNPIIVPVALSADASFKSSTELNVVGNLAFSVQTPIIEAIGVGSRSAEWVFKRSDRPLVGDQHMVVTLRTPKTTEEVATTVRISATVSVFNFLPCNLEKSIPLSVPLVVSEPTAN